MTEVMETLSALALLVIVMGGMASMGLSLKMKQITGPLRDRWTVKIGNGPDMDVQGNILDHEYEIKEGRRKIA